MLPPPDKADVTTYLLNFLETGHQPLAFQLDHELKVQRIDGSPEYYGFHHPAIGTPLPETLPLLEGIFEHIDTTPEVLPFISTPKGLSTHIHLFKNETGYGVIFLNATEEHDRLQQQQQQANELQLLKKKHEKLLAELKRANSAKSRFIANMSHEFRTPLTSVLGYSDLLRELPETPTKAETYLLAIERNAHYLLVMIDNLLDQARFDDAELHINPTRTNLDPVLSDLATLIQPLTNHKQLKFDLIVESQLPDYVFVDEMRLRQLLINLVGNAVKYTTQGNIRVNVRWSDNRLSIAVKDSGPGIPEALQKTIFEPFQQNTAINTEKGAGLGLAISREISHLMGGDLTLRTSSPEGSEFLLSMPAEEVQFTRFEPGEHRAAKLLIVEDDPDIQALLAFYLESSGYSLAMCENGAEAIELAMEYQPDLILMDLNMPRMDGNEAVRILRQKGYKKPMIAMTAAAESLHNSAMASGFDEYLQKPIDAAHLKESIATLLSAI